MSCFLLLNSIGKNLSLATCSNNYYYGCYYIINNYYCPIIVYTLYIHALLPHTGLWDTPVSNTALRCTSYLFPNSY